MVGQLHHEFQTGIGGHDRIEVRRKARAVILNDEACRSVVPFQSNADLSEAVLHGIGDEFVNDSCYAAGQVRNANAVATLAYPVVWKNITTETCSTFTPIIC